jgi:hypothetical protein
MNTPTHALLNLTLIGRSRSNVEQTAILVGGILPDVPMFVFYAFEKARGTSERMIWDERYFQSAWQGVFDLFNSLPLILFLLMTVAMLRRPAVFFLLLSMLLHTVVDFFVHVNDAHRHFYPFSNYRFQSLISYWNPAHYGWLVSPFELILVLIASVLSIAWARSWWIRCGVLFFAISYFIGRLHFTVQFG